MEKISNTIKMKILFVVLFSNVSVYMLASTASPVHLKEINIFEERKGFVDFKLSGQLLTSFSPNKPITIMTKDKKVYIPFAILREVSSESASGISFESHLSQPSYIIHLPESFIPKLLGRKDIKILPFGKNYASKKMPQRKKGQHYEIFI